MRCVPFVGQLGPLTSLTLYELDRVLSHDRPHGEWCLPNHRSRRGGHLLVLNFAPQPLHQDIVVAAVSSGPADPDVLLLQLGHEASRGELAALIGVEDPWFTAAFQSI